MVIVVDTFDLNKCFGSPEMQIQPIYHKILRNYLRNVHVSCFQYLIHLF